MAVRLLAPPLVLAQLGPGPVLVLALVLSEVGDVIYQGCSTRANVLSPLGMNCLKNQGNFAYLDDALSFPSFPLSCTREIYPRQSVHQSVE